MQKEIAKTEMNEEKKMDEGEERCGVPEQHDQGLMLETTILIWLMLCVRERI